MKARTFLLTFILFSFPLFNQAQLSFLENKGQWDQQVLFRSVDEDNSFFLTKDGYTMLMRDAKDARLSAEYAHMHRTANSGFQNRLASTVRSHAYKVKFLHTNENPQLIKEAVMAGHENFFIGNDPSKWATGCKSYQAVTYKSIYNDIDLVYYVKDNQLKYDLIIYPGADLSQVQLQYDGVSSLQLRNEELVVGTSVGEVQELKPYSFQVIKSKKEAVHCNYKINGQTISFEVSNYDKEQILVIDPSIVFSSYSKSSADNWGFTATHGSDGSFFGAGIAQPTGFPTTTGAILETGSGPAGSGSPPDIAIIKLSPDGKNRIYATYLGGNGLEQPHSLIADADGNLVIAGRTNSGASFPGTLVGVGGGYDIFVTKINATGTAIIGSMRIGGIGDDGVNITPTRSGANSLQRFYGDDARSEVILDHGGNILVASSTRSVNFPTQNGFQTGLRGNQDAVVLKLNSSATALTWSTTLGGDSDDAGFVLSVNPLSTSNIYVAGGTGSSTNFTGMGGALQATYSGGIADGYIARLQDNGGSVGMVRSSYLGTSNVDIVYAVQFDAKGFPYVTGITTGNWPVINAPYSVANSRQFIAKLQTDLSAFVYSTTFGTSGAISPNISPVAFHVDNCENVYVSGWGGGANSFGGTTGYPTSGTSDLPVTSDALQTVTDGSDFYMFVLQTNAASQLYGSFFGQNGGNGGFDHVEGGTSRFDSQGVLYLAACANCKNVSSNLSAVSSFPITPGVFGDVNPATGSGCNLGMVKIQFDYAGSNCLITSDNLLRNDLVTTLSFFPNPSKGKFIINFNAPSNTSGRYNLRIFDAKGVVVLQQHFMANRSSNQLMIDMHEKATGIYFVELTNANGKPIASGNFLIE